MKRLLATALLALAALCAAAGWAGWQYERTPLAFTAPQLQVEIDRGTAGQVVPHHDDAVVVEQVKQGHGLGHDSAEE